MSSLASVLVFGFVLGLRHATDADHVVAVSAIASRERSIAKAVAVGVAWGVGHAFTVLLLGAALVWFGIGVPPRLGLGMEFLVALMLIAVGVVNLRGAVRGIRSAGHAHVPVPALSVPMRASALRSLGVGVVHGVAGSAAVALLVLASIRQFGDVVVYLLVFGAGTVVGMVLLTFALAVPVAYAAQRFDRLHRGLMRTAGVLSVGFGVFLAYRIGVVEGLLLP